VKMRRWLSTVRAAGQLYTWGDGVHTKLGRKEHLHVYKPELVQSVSATEVLTGPRHTLVMTAEQGLVGFGDNEFGQVGNGKTETALLPEPVQGLGNVKAAACGLHYSLAVTNTGELYEWGYPGRNVNLFSRLFGRSVSVDKRHPVPEKVAVLQGVSEVAAGELHFLAVTGEG